MPESGDRKRLPSTPRRLHLAVDFNGACMQISRLVEYPGDDPGRPAVLGRAATQRAYPMTCGLTAGADGMFPARSTFDHANTDYRI